MARNYQRDEREWRRGQQRNSPVQYRWAETRRDDEYDWNERGAEGQDWRWQGDEGQDWRYQNQQGRNWRGQGQDERWSRQGMQGGQQWRNVAREIREGDYESGQSSGWGGMNEGYGHLGGRGWYEGYTDAMHREGRYSGRGPRNYKRSDSRIEEDINDRLTFHGMLDATDIEVSVQSGEVTLRGYAEDRQAKRLAEDISESVFGVKEVNNQIKVRQRGGHEDTKSETEGAGKQRKAS